MKASEKMKSDELAALILKAEAETPGIRWYCVDLVADSWLEVTGSEIGSYPTGLVGKLVNFTSDEIPVEGDPELGSVEERQNGEEALGRLVLACRLLAKAVDEMEGDL